MTESIKFTITGRLDGLNDYVLANRQNKYAGANLKKTNEKAVIFAIERQKVPKWYNYPITLKITWYEPNLRRDVDNVTFAVKFILDAMVKSGVIENDSQKYVSAIYNTVKVDRDNPRIEVEICES